MFSSNGNHMNFLNTKDGYMYDNNIRIIFPVSFYKAKFKSNLSCKL